MNHAKPDNTNFLSKMKNDFQYPEQTLQNREAHVFTYSNYDVDAGGKSSLSAANSKSYDGLQVSARVGSKLP